MPLSLVKWPISWLNPYFFVRSTNPGKCSESKCLAVLLIYWYTHVSWEQVWQYGWKKITSRVGVMSYNLLLLCEHLIFILVTYSYLNTDCMFPSFFIHVKTLCPPLKVFLHWTYMPFQKPHDTCLQKVLVLVISYASICLNKNLSNYRYGTWKKLKSY